MKRKILLLADIASSHTQKWAIALADQGCHVGIFSLNHSNNAWYESHQNIKVLRQASGKKLPDILPAKLGYFFKRKELLNTIHLFGPDILHAHYASSYGFIGAISRFKPFFISAWGSDVFEFPKRSILHKWLLKWTLKKADKLFSTSLALRDQMKMYTSKQIEVVPFGVNTHYFKPSLHSTPHLKLRIGIVKGMEDIYGIEIALQAVRLVQSCLPLLHFELHLVGGGSRIDHYKKLCEEYNIADKVVFAGKVPHSEVLSHHQCFDMFLNLTIVDESFGVSVLEAMACEKPVIVSKVPGMIEIVKPGTGIIIEKENPQELAKAIIRLSSSKAQRQSLGKNAREHVVKNYQFRENLSSMMHFYEEAFKEPDLSKVSGQNINELKPGLTGCN
ncbi:MAG: glycosyltransferase [Bacteroidia bacterium]|nr:glycosyltransferase [Bacteroidia bacterium]